MAALLASDQPDKRFGATHALKVFIRARLTHAGKRRGRRMSGCPPQIYGPAGEPCIFRPGRIAASCGHAYSSLEKMPTEAIGLRARGVARK
ncbi:MAG: hypothetical protein JO288_05490 [Hyphomicrobiales bacterium]|nr:hypothetical protein [Hyphomicrobiales bacterium]